MMAFGIHLNLPNSKSSCQNKVTQWAHIKVHMIISRNPLAPDQSDTMLDFMLTKAFTRCWLD